MNVTYRGRHLRREPALQTISRFMLKLSAAVLALTFIMETGLAFWTDSAISTANSITAGRYQVNVGITQTGQLGNVTYNLTDPDGTVPQPASLTVKEIILLEDGPNTIYTIDNDTQVIPLGTGAYSMEVQEPEGVTSGYCQITLGGETYYYKGGDFVSLTLYEDAGLEFQSSWGRCPKDPSLKSITYGTPPDAPSDVPANQPASPERGAG